MILLDTHIWVWWATANPRLKPAYAAYIAAHETQGLGVSIISCWEVAMLASRGRLSFSMGVESWVSFALLNPLVSLIQLSPQIAVQASCMPGTFHRDPADQIIVATARAFSYPLLTVDAQIRAYPHVQCVA
jgi:PIN domain nuclease of toxin-antitoxin system